MPSYFNLEVDTTGPAAVTALINSGDAATVSQVVSVAVGTSDSPTTGIQIKIWGDVDTSDNANIQATEGASTWITLATPHSVKLSSGDGSKTLTVRLRDDVWNESSTASDSITLDSTAPTAAISTGPDVTRISTVSGKRTVALQFTANEAIQAWKIKVVPATSSVHTAGAQIGTTNGSTGVSGGSLAASTPQPVSIDGRDVVAADAGDGTKIVKIFVQDLGGTWSSV